MSIGPDYTFQDRLQSHHANLLAEYKAKPFGDRHRNAELERALDHAEQAMLDNPPWHRSGKLWVPRKTGALLESPLPKGTLPPLKAMSFAEAGLKVIPDNDVADIISDPNRTPPGDYTEGELDQDAAGSCGCEGSCRGVMNRRRADGQEHILLNPWMIYSVVSGGVDRGSNPRDVMAYLQKYGCCSMDVRPRSDGWQRKPNDRELQDASQYRILPDGLVWAENWPEMRTLILLGFPVPFGYPGHWICAVEVISLTRLAYDNSWSFDWGDHGRGTLANTSIEWAYGVVGVKSVTDRSAA